MGVCIKVPALLLTLLIVLALLNQSTSEVTNDVEAMQVINSRGSPQAISYKALQSAKQQDELRMQARTRRIKNNFKKNATTSFHKNHPQSQNNGQIFEISHVGNDGAGPSGHAGTSGQQPPKIPIRRTNGALGFEVELGLGGRSGGPPPHWQRVLLDTGSSVTWVQCEPCNPCMPQLDPIYNPLHTKTFTKLSCGDRRCLLLPENIRSCDEQTHTCMFHEKFVDGTEAGGEMGVDIMKLGDEWKSMGAMVGCSHQTSSHTLEGQGGVLALNRGASSFVSMEGALFNNVFSICFPSTSRTGRGYLKLGGAIGPKPTSLLRAPYNKDEYYVPLIGLGVNHQKLPINPRIFDISPIEDQDTGVLVDTGSTLTFLPKDAYIILRDQLRKAMSELGLNYISSSFGHDTCYIDPTHTPNLPTLQLFFEHGVELSIESENLYIYAEYPGGFSGKSDRAFCLAIMPQPDDVRLSVIGNTLMGGLEWAFDINLKEMSVSPCDN